MKYKVKLYFKKYCSKVLVPFDWESNQILDTNDYRRKNMIAGN